MSRKKESPAVGVVKFFRETDPQTCATVFEIVKSIVSDRNPNPVRVVKRKVVKRKIEGAPVEKSD